MLSNWSRAGHQDKRISEGFAQSFDSNVPAKYPMKRGAGPADFHG